MFHINLTPDMDSVSATRRTESPVGTLCQRKTPEEEASSPSSTISSSSSSPSSSPDSNAKVWMVSSSYNKKTITQYLVCFLKKQKKQNKTPQWSYSIFTVVNNGGPQTHCLDAVLIAPRSWCWGEGPQLNDKVFMNGPRFFFIFKAITMSTLFFYFFLFYVIIKTRTNPPWWRCDCGFAPPLHLLWFPTCWEQMWAACRCSGSLRKINPFRRLHSNPASVLTSDTMIKWNSLLIWRKLFLVWNISTK